MIKSDVTNRLNILKRFGCEVETRNSRYPMPTGMKGTTDHFIITPNGFTIWIECKLSGEPENSEQIRYKGNLRKALAHNPYIRYYKIESKKDLDKYEKEIYEMMGMKILED